MNFFGRAQEKRERKEKNLTGPSAPLSAPPTSHSNHNRPDKEVSARSPSSASHPPSTTNDSFDQFVDENDASQSSSLQNGKRRTVSISRSGRYRTKNKTRTRVLSEDIYSGTTDAAVPPAHPSPAATTQTPTAATTTSPVPSTRPPPTTSAATDTSVQKSKGLVKPSARDKSPVRPYIILKSDTSVNFAIESTTL